MKRLFLLVSCFAFISVVFAQSSNPLRWEYSAKKIADKTFEIHLIATIDTPWHVYSQFTPDGGPIATSIKFVNNPLVKASGKIKEIGKLEEKYERVFKMTVKYFSDKVDFVQVVKSKTNAKTNVKGSIEFMVCNDHQCKPPKTVTFSVSIQ